MEQKQKHDSNNIVNSIFGVHFMSHRGRFVLVAEGLRRERSSGETTPRRNPTMNQPCTKQTWRRGVVSRCPVAHWLFLERPQVGNGCCDVVIRKFGLLHQCLVILLQAFLDGLEGLAV